MLSFHAILRSVGAVVITTCFAALAAGQTKPVAAAAAAVDAKAVTVTQIDLEGLKKAITPKSKPLLVNFWATWCGPCREEFPDLVKLDADYRGKIDFITISLDEVEELDRGVPKFLLEMKAEMPAFLLKTADDDAAIAIVSKNFGGALPFTILYDGSGKEAYFRQGKIKIESVRLEIDKLLTPAK